MKPRILVTGGGGQLGRALASSKFGDAEVVAVGRGECDIEIRSQVAQTFDRFHPDAVINAAAYTAVDQAELEPGLAHRVNVDGVRNIAEEAKRVGARVVHVSTDYVFDGTTSAPYQPNATPNPLGVYGSSKLEGEAILSGIPVRSTIVRTGWLYSGVGRNFLSTILEKIRAGEDLRIVSDRIGTPTSATELAVVLLRCALDDGVRGVVHWTNAGSGSWYDFAVEIQKLALQRSMAIKPVKIRPILSAEFPTKAKRPPYSVLDSSILWERYGRPNDWRQALAFVLDTWGSTSGTTPTDKTSGG